jgi:dTMP kinase
MHLDGRFIVVDGPDGSGKTTQIRRLEAWIRQAGGRTICAKDPGGTPIGERIRHVLLGYDLSGMDPRCEALLFMASRAQLVAEVIRPALQAGMTVLGDRFISATCAYQGAAGVPREEVIALGRLAVGDPGAGGGWPDLTFVLDVPPEVGFARTGRKPHHAARNSTKGQFSMFDGATTDAMERRPLEYHRAVRELFRQLPEFYPRPVVLIDATREAEAVFADLLAALQKAFPRP